MWQNLRHAARGLRRDPRRHRRRGPDAGTRHRRQRDDVRHRRSAAAARRPTISSTRIGCGSSTPIGPTLSLTAFARNLTYPDIDDLRSLPALESVSAFTQPRQMTLGAGRRRPPKSACSSPRPRSFPHSVSSRGSAGSIEPTKTEPGATPTVVLSESFWEARARRRSPDRRAGAGARHGEYQVDWRCAPPGSRARTCDPSMHGCRSGPR